MLSRKTLVIIFVVAVTTLLFIAFEGSQAPDPGSGAPADTAAEPSATITEGRATERREVVRVEEAADSSLRVRLVGFPTCAEEWLALTVFQVPERTTHLGRVSDEQHDEDGLDQLYGLRESVGAHSILVGAVATPDTYVQVSCPVPSGKTLIAVIARAPDKFQNLPNVGVAPLVTSRFTLAPGGEKVCTFDLRAKCRLQGKLVGTASEAKQVLVLSRKWTGLRRLVGRFQVNLDERAQFEVVGLELGRYTVLAVEIKGRSGVELADVVNGDKFVDVSGDTMVTLDVPLETVGEFRMVRDGVLVSTEFSFGVTLRRMPELALRQEPVSIAEFQRRGVERLFFRTDATGLFLVRLKELSHEDDGHIRVELPRQRPGSVQFLMADSKEIGQWRILGRKTTGGLNGMRATCVDGIWRIAGLPKGEYDFFWVDKSRRVPVTIPIALEVHIARGHNHSIATEVPTPELTRIKVANWLQLPDLFKPYSLWVNGMQTRQTDDPAVFTAELAAPLERYTEVLFRCRGIGGAVLAESLAVSEGTLVTTFPNVAVATIRLVPVFGGPMELKYYSQPGTVGSPEVWLPVKVAAQHDGTFRLFVQRDTTTLCLITERDQESRDNIVRGVVALNGLEKYVTADLPGRWVAIDCLGPGPTNVAGVIPWQGCMITPTLANLPEGSSRFWLPDSVSIVRFLGGKGPVVHSADAILSRMRY